MQVFSGIGVSGGIGIGNAKVKKEKKLDIVKKENANPEYEIERVKDACDKAQNQIKDLYNHTMEHIGKEEAQIFEAHETILFDVEYRDQIDITIREEKVNAEYAVSTVGNGLANIFEAIEDNPYLQERAADIKDVTKRIIRNLQQVEDEIEDINKEKSIIVAKDLSPSDTASLDSKNVLGFITEVGGKTSHSAIIAQIMGIPSVSGIENVVDIIKDSDMIIIDGNEGKIYINPTDEVIKEYENKKQEYKIRKAKLEKYKGLKTKTKDEKRIHVVANIGSEKDIESVLEHDAEGVGLFRTEFLFMDRDTMPTEEEQYLAYKAVVQKMKDKPVVIRTLDIGGDKEASYLGLHEEMNPFLGYRAIRICLDQQEIFKTQLRAILRASVYGKIQIMFPMIVSIEELRAGKKILEEAKEDLKINKFYFDENIEVGMMMETPAASILADQFAKEVDFFSIGTNDLIQYTVAVDRMNVKVASLYTPMNPAVLRSIHRIIKCAHKENIWVGMCGALAGDPKFIPILLGMGLDEFSMSPPAILEARSIIMNISMEQMQKHANEIIELATSKEVEEYLKEY